MEFRLLHLLLSHAGWIFETDDIIDRVWGYQAGGDNSQLKNVAYLLRRKIGPDPTNPQFIITETGIGYKFKLIRVGNRTCFLWKASLKNYHSGYLCAIVKTFVVWIIEEFYNLDGSEFSSSPLLFYQTNYTIEKREIMNLRLLGS